MKRYIARYIPNQELIPPPNAEFLFYLFLDTQNCDALVGALEERYSFIYKKFGKHKADFWYWIQAIASVGPVVWAWGKKAFTKPAATLITWAAAKYLVDLNAWLTTFVELYRKIRS